MLLDFDYASADSGSFAGGSDINDAEHKRLKIEIWDHKLHLVSL